MRGAAVVESRPESQDEWVAVGKPLPRLVAGEAAGARNVRITWEGSDAPVVVDVGPALMSTRTFIPLRTDDELFQALRVNDDRNALVWPNGAELSALWIEELAEGSLGNAQFRAAMDEMQMTLDGMAGYLGVARRLIAAYRKDRPIPKSIALATRYLLERRRTNW